jgi:hypothetical protein
VNTDFTTLGDAQLLADLREQVRAGGEVQHDGVGTARADPFLQALVVVGLGQVHAAVVQQLGELREFLVAGALGAVDLDKALADERAVLVIGALVAGDGQDAAAFGKLAMAERLEQRGHELAPRQVAGTAEEYEIEGHDVSCGAGYEPGVVAAVPGTCLRRVVM